MPWTFAHPAAALPFKGLCPRYLSFSGLIVGSLTPDFGYHVNLYGVGTAGHTLKGSFLVCIPAGLALLALFCAMRRPVWWLLPARHRHAVAPWVSSKISLDVRFALVVSVSILIGAWTHIAWDSLTHENTWAYRRFALLREPWFSIGSSAVPGYSALQHLSTLIGVVGLAIAYFWWLRRRPSAKAVDTGDAWRYLVMAGLPVLSFGIAVAIALPASTGSTGKIYMPAFLFKSAILGMSFWISLLFVYSVAYHARSAFARRSRVGKL